MLRMMNELFWKESILTVCNDIFTHTRQARQALWQNSLISDPFIFERMLQAVELPAKKARTEHKNVMQFLGEFESGEGQEVGKN